MRFKQLSSTMEWQVDELQSGMKIQDLQVTPPGSKGVKNFLIDSLVIAHVESSYFALMQICASLNHY